MSSTVDVIVIGGGIAGVSIAYELSKVVRVTVLEMESTLAYHTTGRSAATFLETYGGVNVRALTTASRAFFEEPPDFFEPVLMTPRPLLQFAAAGRGHVVERMHEAVLPLVSDAELLDGAQCCEVFPLLKPEAAERGIYEPRAMALDVAAIHQGYVRGARNNDAAIVRNAEVVTLDRGANGWTVTTADGRLASSALDRQCRRCMGRRRRRQGRRAQRGPHAVAPHDLHGGLPAGGAEQGAAGL